MNILHKFQIGDKFYIYSLDMIGESIYSAYFYPNKNLENFYQEILPHITPQIISIIDKSLLNYTINNITTGHTYKIFKPKFKKILKEYSDIEELISTLRKKILKYRNVSK